MDRQVAATIISRHRAGESASELARNLDLDLRDVRTLIRWAHDRTTGATPQVEFIQPPARH